MIEPEHPASFQYCWQVRRVLQSCLDGMLPIGAADQVAEHLTGCGRCSRDLETYSAIKAALARRRGLPPGVLRRLRDFGTCLLDE